MIENTFIRLAIYGGSIYVLLNLYAQMISDRMIFVPQTPSYTRLPNEVKIESGQGETINAVFLEHPDARYTILFNHGNAEDLGNVVPFMRRFHELGYSVLMYDYRGYGTSEGSPSTRKAKEDAAAAYRWLVDEKGVLPETIIAHGRSLGGALATWIAANHQVGGLVVECAFVSAFRVRTHWPLLPFDKFNNLRSIKKFNGPVLVVHGVDDRIIPVWHGQKLLAGAPGKKMALWIEGGQHNDYVYRDEKGYIEAFQSFMELVGEGQGSTAE